MFILFFKETVTLIRLIASCLLFWSHISEWLDRHEADWWRFLCSFLYYNGLPTSSNTIIVSRLNTTTRHNKSPSSRLFITCSYKPPPVQDAKPQTTLHHHCLIHTYLFIYCILWLRTLEICGRLNNRYLILSTRLQSSPFPSQSNLSTKWHRLTIMYLY